jgi:hypothetical protein
MMASVGRGRPRTVFFDVLHTTSSDFHSASNVGPKSVKGVRGSSTTPWISMTLRKARQKEWRNAGGGTHWKFSGCIATREISFTTLL